MSEEMFREGFLIQQAGEKAGKELIVGALFEKVAGTKIVLDQYGVLNVGSEVLSEIHDPKDIQIALKSIEFHLDSGEANRYDLSDKGKTIVVFILRCRENSVYGNKTAMQRWPDFFQEILGVWKHIPKMGVKDIAPGKDWFANFRDVFSPEHSNKSFDFFEVAVPLAGVLEKLNIDHKDYNLMVKQAEENEARDKGYSLSDERAPHTLAGLKRVVGMIVDEPLDQAIKPVVVAPEPKQGILGKLTSLFRK